ncbi:MAG TPA: radical SAM protein [Candidatus Hydrogenedentes bacterium]|nr:radical SAM protein [Candidatus Hydrogenedentota bacterium]HOS02188.1 radical SAM protein [Candidatus Hydrogenedentota bacterium]
MKKAERIETILPTLRNLMSECCLCGRRCGARRLEGEQGFCRTDSPAPDRVRYASATLHFGEEPMLVGRGGSGTVFFSHCNLRCVFCQNYQISHQGHGVDAPYPELAQAFLTLQDLGAENINLVTPTHYIYPIMLALHDACRQGLELPLVYNTNGFETIELLALLEGIVDIYLPDLKYMDAACADRYSTARNYPESAQAAIKEMFRQTGRVRMRRGRAVRGLIVRHLVMPGDVSGSYSFLLWMKDQNMTGVTISLMSQYSPQYHAHMFEDIARPVTPKEYDDVVQYALDLGFDNLLVQSPASRNAYLPDFHRDKPFDP